MEGNLKLRFDRLKQKVEQLIQTYETKAFIIPKTSLLDNKDIILKYLKLLFLKIYNRDVDVRGYFNNITEIVFLERNILSTTNHITLDKFRLVKKIENILRVDLRIYIDKSLEEIRNKYIIGLYKNDSPSLKLILFIFKISDENDLDSFKKLITKNIKYDRDNIIENSLDSRRFVRLLICDFNI